MKSTVNIIKLQATINATRDLIWNSLQKKSTVFDPKTSLNSDENQLLIRSIPTLVLYNDDGLDLFDQITYNHQYYLTDCEIDIFKNYGVQMAEYVQNDSIVVELGVGAMRKTRHFLNSVVEQNKSPTYYAIDLEEETLRSCLEELAKEFPTIKFVGLCGLYEKGLEYISKLPKANSPKIILWLGSSIGNMTRPEAVEFFKFVDKTALVPGDLFFVGIDRRNEPEVISKAYNDDMGITRDFILNGLSNVNDIFNENIFDKSQFEYVSIYNSILGRHEAYYKSLVDQTLSVNDPKFEDIHLCKGELINVEYSYKYNIDEVETLAHDSKFNHTHCWFDSTKKYGFHMFQRPPFFFPKVPTETLPTCPTLEEFHELWKAWDLVTGTMIENCYEKPISLRLPYIFYFGHIPAFSDQRLNQYLCKPLTEPAEFAVVFERGIDPDVTDGICRHSHSEELDTWPSVEDVLDYLSRVRESIGAVFKEFDNGKEFSSQLKEILFMLFEHEAMHLETLLYMILQSDNLIPPKNVLPPPFSLHSTNMKIPSSSLIDVDGGIEKVGQNKNRKVLGWDLESPIQELEVKAFKIQTRPVTIGEYFKFLKLKRKENAVSLEELIPSSWSYDPEAINSGMDLNPSDFKLKTVFGKLSLSAGWLKSVSCSYVQASAYAESVGMRIPNQQELLKLKRLSLEENGDFVTRGTNVGFSSWLPKDLNIKKIHNDIRDVDICGNGWEWSSSVWEKFEGYKTSDLYPGYSFDFLDGKHNLMFGGSWATHPRLALRNSFKNWFQRDYNFMFAQFRCA
ncbi:hypothetical protein HK099_004837, partial [Clydaea vesicula]